ncbi:peptidase S8/S53 domain-containing protein, partial [Apodospora peruviana]
MSPLGTSLAQTWVIGLVYTLPLLNTVVTAASIPPRDSVITPRPAIAIKLNPDARSPSAAGADIIDSLIQKAHPNPTRAKRDVDFSISPLITSLSPAEIDKMIQTAVERDPTYVPANFSNWFQVVFTEAQTEDAAASPEVLQLLNKLAEAPEVASCQQLIGSTRSLPAVQPNDDPLFTEQGYLSGGGVGIDAKYAWGFPGGDGTGTTIIDVERGWQLEHEDLKAANITIVGTGLNINDRYGGNYPHGTSVLGEILMVDNTIGGVGIATKAQGHVVGITRTNEDGGPVENRPEAIMEAANNLKFGDAILLEMQVPDASSTVYPVEIYDAEFDAIRLAVAMGITVIEPAANNGTDLDQPILREGDSTARAFLNRNSPDFRDSGAIIVGAGSPGLPHTRLDFSNYGSRVDVFAWGENIWTTSVNTSSNYEDIYAPFDGTSGAAPIIAGAVLCIQGMVNANRGKKLSPAELRSLITVGGTPTSKPAEDKIGVQPDLRALIDGGHL